MFFWLSPTSLPRLDMSILPPSGAGFGVADVRFGVADVRVGMADVGMGMADVTRSGKGT